MATGTIELDRRGHLRVVHEDERPGLRERLRARRRLRGQRRRARAARRAPTPRVVVLLIGAALLLTGIGLVMVFSASSVSAFEDYGSSFLFLRRQAVYAAIGVVALLVTSRVPFRVWQRLAFPFLVLSLVLVGLALHPTIGTQAGGASRWISLGSVTVQPSELAKLAMVVFVAAILTRKWRRLDEAGHLVLPLVPVLGIACALIMLQRDLGTTTIVAGSALLLLFVAGVRWRYLITGVLLCGGAGAALIMTEGYRRARLFSFWNPWEDPTNTGYQLIQSLIGLGSGGWLGVGLGASRQKWSYIPNAHTDFVFSILGEELGLVGALAVLLLFGVLLYTAVRVAVQANDTFGRLLAAGIVSWLGLQTLINLGAVTGVLPVTGVPLPFVSFGGSSLIVTLAAVGILVNIGRTAGGPPAVPSPPRRRPPRGRARVRARARTAARVPTGRARARRRTRAGAPARTPARARA